MTQEVSIKKILYYTLSIQYTVYAKKYLAIHIMFINE